MLNDARVASLGFFKDNICTTRINKEKKFKIKFQVLLKLAQILPDYLDHQSDNLWNVLPAATGKSPIGFYNVSINQAIAYFLPNSLQNLYLIVFKTDGTLFIWHSLQLDGLLEKYM